MGNEKRTNFRTRVISPVDFVDFIRNTRITFTNSFSPEEAIK